MFYRVTQSRMAETARDYLAKQTSQLFLVQQQISSGVRIQRPADDPAGTRRSLIQKDRVVRLEAHEVSIQHAMSRLQTSEVHLRDVNSMLTRVRDIALQAPQITDEIETRAFATELDGLLNQILNVANTADENGYLFSGTSARTQPFPSTVSTGGRETYSGADDEQFLHIAGDATRQTLLPGNQVFQPVSRGTTVVLGATGVTPGTGTDSGVGLKQLIVTHTLTTYAAGSGIAAGTSSVTGDTVLGPAGLHTLQIQDTSGTGAFGTVSLNGGTPVAYTSTDTNLEVTGPDGQRVYVDTTAIVPGFSGNADITADGTLSVDGGLTTSALTFSTSQAIMDSRDGSVVNLNTSAVVRAGTNELEFPGTTDIFNAVRNLRNDILNTRGLDPAAQKEALNRRLGDIDRIQDHLLNIVGIQGASMEQIQRLETRTGDLKLAEELEYSETTSADIAAAVLRLQELNNLQQFTMAAVGQLLTPNLLSYIQ